MTTISTPGRPPVTAGGTSASRSASCSTGSGLDVTLARIGGALAVTAAGFRWRPGAPPVPLTAGRR